MPLENFDELNPDTMDPKPRDGKKLGEVILRENVVMKGYVRNAKATKEAFVCGWRVADKDNALAFT